MTRAALRRAARGILRAGLDAVEPGRLVRRHLHSGPGGLRVGGQRLQPRRTFVVAVGKAAVAMGRSAQRILGRRMTAMVVIAPTPTPRLPRTVSFVAGHPIPNAAGLRASREVCRLLGEGGERDLVLLLLSGGSSALMPCPVTGVSLRDKQRVTRLLLRRGASIDQLNAVRKSLSRLKGGGFARLASPARVVALVLSDVPGDDIATIGSGPTIDDPRAHARARRVVKKHLRPAELPAGVRRALERPRPRQKAPVDARTLLIGSGRTFAEAAAEKARGLGFAVTVAPDALRGEARRAGPALVARFRRARGKKPRCLIATGETVVKVRGPGAGGRNQELALAAAPALARSPKPAVLASFATDGQDGPTEASGGLIDDGVARAAEIAGLSIRSALDRNDSHAALALLGGLLVTGPTGTNVADVALVLG